MAKIRVGVLLDSFSCSPELYDTVWSLSRNRDIDLYALKNQTHCTKGLKKVFQKIKNVGVARFISIVFFNIVESLERKILKSISKRVRAHFVVKEIEPHLFKECIELNPIFSNKKISVTYPESDLDRLCAINFDLLLRGNGTGIYKGKILSTAKNGIISFHHGDNRWNRGGPPGFWEVYLKKPSTGFLIQILNEELDGGDVIFRGEVPTKKTYIENMVNLYQASNPFMAKIISEFASSGILPSPSPSVPIATTILKTPKFSITAHYIAQMACQLFKKGVTRKILGKHQRWSVAFVPAKWKNADLGRAIIVKNPRGRFLADPFIAKRDGQTSIFVEDYRYDTQKGVISAIKIFPDRSYEIIEDIIPEECHQSFPYVFDYNGTLYMVPETHEAQAIKLYRCVRFPDKWIYEKDLMQNVSAVDTMIFEHAGTWWLLTTIPARNSHDYGSLLYAFSADNPLSTSWTPHKSNPVSFSAAFGRNAGLVLGEGGELFRVRQKQGFNQYGEGFSIAKIEKLDHESFEEKLYQNVEPTFLKDIVGTHHMHSNGEFTVFDFVREERIT